MMRLWSVAAIAAAFGMGTGLIVGLKVLPSGAGDGSKSKAADGAIAPQRNSDLDSYQDAIVLANQAIATAESAENAEARALSLKLTQQERILWQNALAKLARIPARSELHERATAKQRLYRQKLAIVEGTLTAAKQTFLADIIQAVDVDSTRLHVTLCQLDPLPVASAQKMASPLLAADGQLNRQRCRHHQGDQFLASPASLIKVPIAIALMFKVHEANLDPSQKILIDPNNFTENGGDEPIEVGNEYSLQEIMEQMIEGSDNIATNQLVDYLGYAYIEKALTQLGYRQTSVGHKLMGDQVMPINFGNGTNRATTDNITAMMAQIYSGTRPGDDIILAALSRQQDQEIGYSALQSVDPAVKWLGEKTGQNNRVIGTTLAVEIDQVRYILTVALDNDSDIYMLQQIIGQIATYLAQNGPLKD
ncbi:MAG: serine hydrolase [Phormidesmis sp. RL_2_1]|nr:serine hydrolase [Phormidesmis sp. RL_2_1]